MVHEPAPATLGENVPVAAFVIPVPLHVPPGCAAVNVAGTSFRQKGPAGVIVASHDGQGCSASTSLIIISFPFPSIMRTVSAAGGGVAVVPVAKLFQAKVLTAHPGGKVQGGNGKPEHVLQFCT